MIRGIKIPTCSSASDGAVSFFTYFTNGRTYSVAFIANERYKIALYLLFWCGIITNAENFKFEDGFCFMSSHLKMVVKHCADFSRALTWIFEI